MKMVVKRTVDSRTILERKSYPSSKYRGLTKCLAVQRKKETAINKVLQDDLTDRQREEVLGGEFDGQYGMSITTNLLVDPELLETFEELLDRFGGETESNIDGV